MPFFRRRCLGLTSRLDPLAALRRRSSTRSEVKFSQSFRASLTAERNAIRQQIKKFVRDNNVPEWLRGVSAYQIRSAENLPVALRDDKEQKSVHRVRKILQRIGLRPLLKDNLIHVLIKLSNGSDLAFLYFTMCLGYKSSVPGRYNLNEQIIMSLIQELDLVATLQELDRILPPGHESLKKLAQTQKLQEEELAKVKIIEPQQEQRQRQQQQRRKLPKSYSLFSFRPQDSQRLLLKQQQQQSSKSLSNIPASSRKLLRPYLEKQIRPKPYGKCLSATQPPYKTIIDLRSRRFEDPKLNNRWFADYKLNMSKRLAVPLIDEEIKLLVQRCDEPKLSKTTITGLCATHMQHLELERNLERELRLIAQENCRKYFAVENVDYMQRKRVLDGLEENIQRYMSQYRTDLEKSRLKAMSRILNQNQNLEDATTYLYSSTERKKADDLMKSMHNLGKLLRGSYATAESESKENKAEELKVAKTAKHVYYDERVKGGEENNKAVENEHVARKSDRKSVTFEIEKPKEPEPIDTKILSDTEAYSAKYFHKPTEHQPYQFDYGRIFDFDLQAQVEKPPVRCTLLKALDCEIGKMANGLTIFEQHENAVSNAAVACAEKMTQQTLLKHAKEQQQYAATQLEAQHKKMQYYDCDNMQQMNQLLKDALAEIAKNPYYVLASLPDAHRVPALREWVRQRYGKIYSVRERNALCRTSYKIFKLLRRLRWNISLPLPQEITKTKFIDTDRLDFIKKKIKATEIGYLRQIEYKFMEYSRICWWVSQPYLSSSGPPRNCFFAYLPARCKDIYHRYLWKNPKAPQSDFPTRGAAKRLNYRASLRDSLLWDDYYNEEIVNAYKFRNTDT